MSYTVQLVHEPGRTILGDVETARRQALNDGRSPTRILMTRRHAEALKDELRAGGHWYRDVRSDEDKIMGMTIMVEENMPGTVPPSRNGYSLTNVDHIAQAKARWMQDEVQARLGINKEYDKPWGNPGAALADYARSFPVAGIPQRRSLLLLL